MCCSRRFARILPSIALLVAVAMCSCGPKSTEHPYGLDPSRPIEIDKKAGEVRILADLQPQAFKGRLLRGTPGYHAVVWKKGGAAAESLLAAYVDDATLHDALQAIGAIPGNNLTMAAWNKRNDPVSKAPDTRVEGTPVDIRVWWNGLSAPVPLKDLMIDRKGRGIHMRFGGNKALIPEWRSGCIACLYSCPGGKVSNRAYTIRDYLGDPTNFAVDPNRVPEGTRSAVVIFRVAPAP